MKKFLAVILILAVPLHTASALNVGVAPLITELGDIQPGTQISGSFYVVADGSSGFVADLITMPAPVDFYFPERNRQGYVFEPLTSSEEDVSEWITFLDNSVTIPKDKYFVPEINYWVNKKIDFVLTVPEDAESGYHAGQVLPQPRVTATGTGGVGVGIITLVKTTFVFNVPGEATRDAEIVGFDYRRIDERYEEIMVLVKNTGSVTESVKLLGVEIDEGSTITQLQGVGYKNIRPNQIIEFKTRYDVSDKESGSYKTTARISWITGEKEKDGIIEVLDYREPAAITGKVAAPPPGTEFPLWVVPMLIIFSAIVLYWWHNGKY